MNLLILAVCLTTIKSVYSINCYQCSGTDSNDPFQCNEYLDSESSLVPTDCSLIHNAQFCIKHVGRFEGYSIECYQCNSTGDMECGDGLMNLDGGILRATPCDQVYNAQYCVKEIGGIGTKRFCSSLDLGNQCKYVQQPGDKLEYRTCIYTCTTDGCNSAITMKLSAMLLMLALFVYKCV
ncbi:U-scoloptoxin(05)-Sm1a isoform X2 [Colias croceus]|uniref:U-scoloptoxin(05)-Sm1a isoform X2 n=1 Tax=Colias crocea TaxID=72248 RepID=UPI001E27B3FE|nr:U-scoloptoxin(05)-Sm1a isoform X2 [Colias croceus]